MIPIRFNLRIVVPLLKVGELLIYAHSCFWIDKFEREHGWLEIREGWNRRIITVLNAWWNAFKLVEFIGKLFISILYMYVYLFSEMYTIIILSWFFFKEERKLFGTTLSLIHIFRQDKLKDLLIRKSSYTYIYTHKITNIFVTQFNKAKNNSKVPIKQTREL